MYGIEGIKFCTFSAVGCDAIPELGLNQVLVIVHSCIGNHVATLEKTLTNHTCVCQCVDHK